MKRKYIYLIIGKSGSGKTTIVNELEKKGFKSVESYTTRPKRFENEKGHIFVSDAEFDDLKNICAYVNYNSYRYCATTEQVNEADLYVIDPKGAQTFKNCYTGKAPYIIYVDAPWYIRLRRMIKRGDSFASAIKRIIVDCSAFREKVQGVKTYRLSNTDLNKSVTKIRSLINSLEFYDSKV